MMCCQEIMASVKSASLATATDHSLYLKIIKVTTCTWVRVRVPCLYSRTSLTIFPCFVCKLNSTMLIKEIQYILL
jgi:hypothetical protein